MGNISGENSLGSRALDGHWERCKSALFWQTERFLGAFSTGTEKEGFTGFSIIDQEIRRGKGG